MFWRIWNPYTLFESKQPLGQHQSSVQVALNRPAIGYQTLNTINENERNIDSASLFTLQLARQANYKPSVMTGLIFGGAAGGALFFFWINTHLASCCVYKQNKGDDIWFASDIFFF